MRAPLSVVIPTLDAAQGLTPCLVALMEGLEAGILREVIISDGGSGDGTLEIADEAGAVLLTGAPGRGGQLRRGADIAKGEWLLFLHADTVLTPGWSRAVSSHMQTAQSAAYFRLRFDVTGLMPSLVAGWANLRSLLFDLPYGDQGLLISKDGYQGAGGYPDLPLMEDVALCRKLRGQLQGLDAIAQTSAARFQSHGWLRQGARNLWFLLRYLTGTEPQTLARSYHK